MLQPISDQPPSYPAIMTAPNITPQDLAAALDSVAIKISSRDDRKNLPVFAGYLNHSEKILELFRQSERIAGKRKRAPSGERKF